MPSTHNPTPEDVIPFGNGQTFQTNHVFVKKATIEFVGLAAAVAEKPFFNAEGPIEIRRAVLISKAAFTGNAACYQWRVKDKGTTGTGTTVVFDWAADTATTDNLVAFKPKVIWTGNVRVEDGSGLSLEVIKNGAPANFDGVLIVEYVPCLL